MFSPASHYHYYYHYCNAFAHHCCGYHCCGHQPLPLLIYCALYNRTQMQTASYYINPANAFADHIYCYHYPAAAHSDTDTPSTQHRLRRWYIITIPSSDQCCTTIENHRSQWLSYPKIIGKPLIPMVALNHSIQW